MILIDDLVRSLAESDYAQGYRAWRDHMSSFDWCLDTGRFGTVGEPGVSDLDCTGLIRDGYHRTAIEAHKAWLARLPSELQFLFPHEPFFITERARQYAPLVHTLHNLHWDAGIGPGACGASAEHRLFQHLAYALAVAPECARRLEQRGGHSLRIILLLLKSLHASESFWAGVVGNAMSTAESSARSRSLRRAVLAHGIGGAQLADAISREVRSSIERLSALLDAYGERVSAETRKSASDQSWAFRLTRTYGRITAAPQTLISASEDTMTLHRCVFALAFGLLPPATPLGAAAAGYWEATKRMTEIYHEERLEEDWYFPRPFYYQPGLDDADLDNSEFNCLAMPAAIPNIRQGGGRMSTGIAGHLVHGPYVRIQKEARYCAEVNYLAECGPPKRAGAFDISVCRIDVQGNQVRFDTLGFADLPPTGRAPGRTRIEFDTTGHSGALLETRVFADAGVQLNVFRIKIWRIASTSRFKLKDTTTWPATSSVCPHRKPSSSP